ncbi:MAG TPA: NifU family protein [Tenericutes bacterium]|jgi:Fe-S cluster biogenesis protein NfuA|nr:NifU family protein [Mycoplasmatota bacterium]
MNEELEKKVLYVLEKIRPFLITDGGDVELVDIKDGVVFIRLLGACANCYKSDITLKGGIELALTEEIPEIIRVEQVD